MVIDDFKDHQQWVRSLLPLSMMCTVMRLRLLPWMWGRLECIAQDPSRNSKSPNPTLGRNSKRPNPTQSRNSERLNLIPSRSIEWPLLGKVNTTPEALHADTCLAASVRYFCALVCPWVGLVHVF